MELQTRSSLEKGDASLKLRRENEFFEKEFDNSTKPDANLGNYSPPNLKSVNPLTAEFFTPKMPCFNR